MRRLLGLMISAVFCVGPSLAFGQAGSVLHEDAVVNGVQVDRYTWADTNGRPRSVSLKKEGNGNPGHGGYAVQMTYQIPADGGEWRTVRADAAPGEGGFGYFVSHERYRNFDNGAYGTISEVVFGRIDAPLGRNFPVAGARVPHRNPEAAAHRFRLTYRKYGTVEPIRKNPDTGADRILTPTDPAKLALYELPVTILWVFQSGTDHPRIQTTVGLNRLPGPDRVNFDVRGPYGVLEFDDGAETVLRKVMWGDRFHFQSFGNPLVRNSSWAWNRRNAGARYTALIAGAFEMGLVEPQPWTSSALVHGYADERGSTSALHNNGNGCTDKGASQLLPCDWAWPYQSAQYSLPDDNPNAPTSFKKIAWGSTAYYGSGPSLRSVWDGTRGDAFDGFPDNGRITYSVCVVLGRTIPGGLTRAVAAGPNYNCAQSAP